MSVIKKIIPKGIKNKIKSLLGIKESILSEQFTDEIVTRKMAGYKATGNVDKYSDKVVVVTGATGHIGKDISLRFAKQGAMVCVCSRSIDKAKSVVNEIKENGFKAIAIMMDLNDLKTIKAAFDEIVSIAGKIDVLVNCAGGSARDEWSPVYDQKNEIIEEIIDTNLTGTIICSKYASQHMIKEKYGKIINISSSVGVGGKSGFSEYAAAKAGIIGFTKSLALELGSKGITVNCVTPGIVQRGDLTESKANMIINKNAMESIGIANDISYGVDFFASDEANFITGQNIIIDGGRTLGLKGD